ncbi:MAG: tetratricopeptide repeat protein, partial [Vicinamibacteria bacterium]
ATEADRPDQLPVSPASPVRNVGAAALDAEPKAEVDEDPRSAELLRQGEELFSSGSYQAAIHVWTRILFLDRGNAEARISIEKVKGLIADEERRLDLKTAEASRLFESGEVEEARKNVRAVLAVDPGHAEAALLQAKLDALDRRNEPPRDPAKPADTLSTPAAAPSKGVVFRVPRGQGTASVPGRAVTPPLQMAAFLIGSVLFFGVAAFYLHENWDFIVSDGAFGHSGALGPSLGPDRQSPPVPDRSELRYFNGVRLFAEGRYREALSELSRVDPRSPVVADARSLILRIEERLLRGATEPEPEPESEALAR